MTTNSVFKSIFVAIISTLLCSSAFAQIQVGASAEASANTDSNNAATQATANTEPEVPAQGAEAEDAPPPPAPMEEDDTTVVDMGDPEPEPAPVAESTGGIGVAGYEGGFFIKTNDDLFKLKINGMVKTQFALLAHEDFNDAGDEVSYTSHARFINNYTRLLLTGNMFTPKLTYAIYYNFPTSLLVYAFADYAFSKNKFHLRVGRFKRPISRNYLNSSVKRTFIESPLGEMGRGVDVGMQISNNYTAVKGLEWAVGIFNSKPLDTNVDFAPVIVGRIGFNNGVKGYSHTDFEGGPFRFGVALSASTEFDHDDDNVTNHYLSVDGIIKVAGLSVSAAITLEHISEDIMFDTPGDDDPTDPYTNSIGSFVQAGYLINQRFEPVARYGFTHGFEYDEDLQEEITGGFTIYFYKHNFKWENNVSLFTHRTGGADPESLQDIRFLSQLQLFF